MSETERNEAVEVTEVSPEPTDTPSLLAELNIDEVVKERDEFKDIACACRPTSRTIASALHRS